MRDAGLTGVQIGYVNAHGTSAPAGDVVEVKGIKRAFGRRRFETSSYLFY